MHVEKWGLLKTSKFKIAREVRALNVQYLQDRLKAIEKSKRCGV